MTSQDYVIILLPVLNCPFTFYYSAINKRHICFSRLLNAVTVSQLGLDYTSHTPIVAIGVNFYKARLEPPPPGPPLFKLIGFRASEPPPPLFCHMQRLL